MKITIDEKFNEIRFTPETKRECFELGRLSQKIKSFSFSVNEGELESVYIDIRSFLAYLYRSKDNPKPF